MNAKSALQDEIKQARPFRSPAEEATLGLMRTATIIRRHISRAIEPTGITTAQYNVLRILRGAGSEGLPTLAVRDRLIEEAPGITRLLDKLERSGYVHRERSTPDRRQVMCFITLQGLTVLKALDEPVSAADEIGGIGLTLVEQKALVKLLDKVRAGVREVAGT